MHSKCFWDLPGIQDTVADAAEGGTYVEGEHQLSVGAGIWFSRYHGAAHWIEIRSNERCCRDGAFKIPVTSDLPEALCDIDMQRALLALSSISTETW